MRFHITGKCVRISREEARAILHACDALLSYHGRHPRRTVPHMRGDEPQQTFHNNEVILCSPHSWG